ncbi:hypothetical protein J6590_024668 [Homalodisca vitripennis]|nr:hypothetical protein J6590_024668 [Homalodisca vitripennis]
MCVGAQGEALHSDQVRGASAQRQHDTVAETKGERHVEQVVQEEHPSQAGAARDLVLLEEQVAEDLEVGEVPGDVGESGPEARAGPATPHEQPEVEGEEQEGDGPGEEVLTVGDRQPVDVVQQGGHEKTL